MAVDKRKHARVHHRDTVELTSGDHTFSGTSVNVSLSGMQVVVKMPSSYDSVKSIAFQIPGSSERIHLPCRLIRNSEQDGEGDQVLGVEFLSEADAQLLLIEKFIQETQLSRNDARQLPRTSCHLSDVTVESPELEVLSIENLSTEGLLLNYRGSLKQGDTLALTLGIPGDGNRLSLSGTVMYVIDNVFQGALTAGMQLSMMKEVEKRRLRNLIVSCASGSALRDLHDHLDAKATDPEYRIAAPEIIEGMFQSLKVECVHLSTLVDGSFTILEHEVEGVDSGSRQFSIKPDRELVGRKVNPGDAAYFAFYWNKGSHYFKAHVTSVSDDILTFPFPTVIFRSDKRSYQRKPLQASGVSLAVVGEKSEHTFDGTLVDISRRGFLCELRVSPEYRRLFHKGKSLRYVVDERLGLGREGQIRRVTALPSPDGVVLLIGVEAGIGRSAVRYKRIAADKWEKEKSKQDPPNGPERRIDSVFVRFPDRAGRELSAIINGTRLHVKVPVVIIPSAYGKKKEALSPLVATLLANFWSEGKDIVTLRYDGINRPGESHQDEAHPKPGYEMLSYRISQGLGDLQAALDFVHNNPYFMAEKVVIVSFSMSALDVRRLLSQGDGNGVDFWVSCMGVPCGQTTLRYVLGGIDIVSNHRLGIHNGVTGLLGHLVDMDVLAVDVVEKKYAFLTDARLDMSRISIPVLWIYGIYDRWVDMDEVKDLMSVKAPASREILEIPTGHNLRSSDDALQTFKLITSSIHDRLFGTQIRAHDPWKDELMRLITAERERLQNRVAPPLTEYWRGYLIGNERNAVGYDFYQNIPEFTDFLRKQAQSLELGDDEVIADLGCGTGIFLEELLRLISDEGKRVSIREIVAVDLVRDALEKAKEKCTRALSLNPDLADMNVRFVQKNLEPNRLIPVSRFIESEGMPLDSLRNRIEGLSSKILDRLIECASPELYAIMRGATPEGEPIRRLASTLEPEELKTVLEFNRAARFLRERIGEQDVKPDRRSAAPLGSLRCSDLMFERLDLGDCDSTLSLGFPENYFTKIVASLFISYLRNPDYALAEFHHMLKPGGILLVSSMKPDSDISMLFTDYIRKVQSPRCFDDGEKRKEEGVVGARAMLNEAASLFELEEDGFFRFYTQKELKDMLSEAGFSDITVLTSLGNPPQANIVVAKKRLTLS
jgi:ubiquinone/menaquinone biosynthesis C-methylase UbiE